MAIVFQSSSISGANAGAAGLSAQTAIRDALVAHPSGAWTLFEEFDSTSGTVHWVVLKNDKTISLNGVDFYICIGRVTATGQIGILLGETYTLATRTLSTYVPSSSTSTGNNTILVDGVYAGAAGGSPSSFALGTSLPTAPGLPVAPVNTPAATMRFVPMVEKDYAIINLNTTTWYIGALTDLIVPNAGLVAAVPIGLVDLFSGSQTNFGALTRHPIAAADAPMQLALSHALIPLVISNMVAIQRMAFNTALYLNGDRFQGNRVSASEIAALMAASSYNSTALNSASRVGALRAKFKSIRLATYPTAAALYDTIVVDSRKHIILNDKGVIPGGGGGEFLTPTNYNSIRHGFVFDTGVAA